MHAIASAQWINFLTVTPANPTSSDTITVLANCSFPSGSCSTHSQNISIAGNDIYASAFHCLGVLTVICNYTDTFIINPLPAGNYTFHFQVNAGMFPAPCTPGPIPAGVDSIQFVVSPATGIDEFLNQDEVMVVPNPVKDLFSISGLSENDLPANAELFSQEGKVVRKFKITHVDQIIDLTTLPAAIYQLNLITGKQQKIILPIIKLP
jgi:hypothetical protein